MLKQNVLLSNVEQTTDLSSTNPNVDAYPRLSGCLLKNNLSDKLHHSSKQVRFRPNVSIDSTNHLTDDLSCDGLNELNTVTSSVDNSDSIPHLRNHYSPENVPTRSPSYNVSEGVRENNVNKVYNLSTDIESHLMSNCQNTSSFRTTDHLPQQPLSSSPHSSVSGFRSCHSDVRRSSSDQDPRELLSSSFTQPDNLSLSSLTDLSCLDSDNSFSNHDYGTLNFSIPVSNTVKTLEREIKALSMKVNNASKSSPTHEIRLEAERIVNQACNTLPNGDNPMEALILNPRITINIPENMSIYENLIDLSVDESEIVRLERQRIAAQRKRFIEANEKQNAKVNEPEPDLLEFFNPNRHVYQSVNLEWKGIRNLLPTLQHASEDLVNVFQQKLLCDYYSYF